MDWWYCLHATILSQLKNCLLSSAILIIVRETVCYLDSTKPFSTEESVLSVARNLFFWQPNGFIHMY